MPRTFVVVAGLVAGSAVTSLAYMHATRSSGEVSRGAPSNSSLPTAAPSVSAPNEQLAVPVAIDELGHPAAVGPANAVRPVTGDDVVRMIADTQSHDAKTRAAAIAALANAPKAQAVPALERVLESGEPQVDRQIALQSLYTLALNEGDADSGIRDAIRNTLYHSDDEAVTQSAQSLLEDIEAEFAVRAQRR